MGTAQKPGLFKPADGTPPPSGNMLWYYDADFTVESGGDVVTWNDLSGNGWANGNATQAVGGNRATLNVGDLGGHNTASFNGSADRYDASHSIGITGITEYTVVGLSQRAAGAATAAICDASDHVTDTNRGFHLGQNGGVRNTRYQLANDVNYAFSSTAWVIHVGIGTGGTLKIYEGTVLKATNGALPAINFQIQYWRIGSLKQDVWPWDGKIAQCLAYRRAWGPSDLAQYVASVNARYGLSLV